MKGKKHNGYGKSFYEHKYCRRSKEHDYKKPCTYHVIIKKNSNCSDFGHLAGNPRIAPGVRGCAFIMLSPIGKIINNEIFEWARRYPVLKTYQHIVMPDHIHILVRVTKEIEKAFGVYVNWLKGSIQIEWNKHNGSTMPGIFQEDFTDKIIYPRRSLKEIIYYIKLNPHRLSIRKMHPEFFIRKRNIIIDNEEWEAYGNIFNMRNPFKETVIVHRIDSEEDFNKLMDRCLENSVKGGVVVSAFIAKREKIIRDAIIDAEGRMIHIQRLPFTDRFKPEKARFEQCEMGNLLILAPKHPLLETREREQCLHLNRIAEAVTAGNFSF